LVILLVVCFFIDLYLGLSFLLKNINTVNLL
jgi:hypothetical protein